MCPFFVAIVSAVRDGPVAPFSQGPAHDARVGIACPAASQGISLQSHSLVRTIQTWHRYLLCSLVSSSPSPLHPPLRLHPYLQLPLLLQHLQLQPLHAILQRLLLLPHHLGL